jgi:hypothetical protein
MQHRTWSALLVVVGLVQGAPAHATPSCADQLGTYDKWIAPIKADVARGAVMSDRVDELVAIPLRAGSSTPRTENDRPPRSAPR